MKLAISTKLMKLAKLFKGKNKLYMVGGFVRNSLIGCSTKDIDLAGPMTVEEVKTTLEKTDYVVNEKNLELGTCEILFDDVVCEYTTFRKEIYSGNGEHSPSSVEFTKDIEEDAKRRDFTVNAIYFDITKGTLIDFYDGVKDAQRHIIRAIGDSDELFSNDGVRILRMIRLASELKFMIEGKTWQSANRFKSNLYYISNKRKLDELFMFLNAPEKYERASKRAHIKALKRINALSICKAFCLPVEKIKLNLIKKAKKEERKIALIIDTINTVKPRSIKGHIEEILGVGGLNIQKEKIEEITNVVEGYFDAIKNVNNKDYFFKYFYNFEKILKLIELKSKKIAKKYYFFYKYIKNNKIAIVVKDLAIKGSDIKNAYPNIPQRRYAFILEECLSKVFDGVLRNTKENLLKEVDNYDY